MLALMSIWIFLFLLSIGIFSVLAVLLHKNLSEALKLGLYLAIFDFFFENLGGYFGLWTTKNSILFLGFVPIEVFFIATLAGATYYLLFPRNWDTATALSTSFLIAVVGAMLEAGLVSGGYLEYMNWWNSYWAVLAYFLTFLMMYKVNLLITKS
ncbi:hypothetical protein [Methanococcoides vulcani]|uniref:hypothetical protein n=1 Tax=Methanococcoides vulcani TaxID=1353158 RepID=UPI000B88EB4B|nr:hypothetical protein [Methanococcoides vulcani]